MGISFFENMSGTLVDNDGNTHTIDFEIHCESTHFGAFLQSGDLHITGILRARPWAEELPVEGLLRLSPLRKKTLEYDLKFRDEEGRVFRLFGKKNLSLGSRLMGMVDLQVELTQGKESLARGEMHFNLNELLAFISSFSFRHAFGRLDLKGAILGKDISNKKKIPVAHVLNEDEKRILFALGEIIIVPNKIVSPVTMETILEAVDLLNFLPSHIQYLYRSGIKILNTASFGRYAKAFYSLNISQRKKLIFKLDDLVFALSAPIKTAHFSQKDYLKKVGLRSFENTVKNEVKNESARWKSQILSPSDLDTESLIPCDVVIVGTGAGGAPLAAKLAEKGFAVAIVEAGDYFDRADFSGAPEKRTMRLSRDGGMNMALGNSRVIIPTGKLVGGSTAINSGTCLDTPDAILENWRAKGFPEDFKSENFSKWISQTRRELQVEKAKDPWLGEIANRMAKGAENFRTRFPDLTHGALLRNAPGCDGQGLCPMGCPTAAKRSSDISWIPRALKAGATCFTGMTVRRILKRGKRVVAIEAFGRDALGAPKTLRLKASAIVVSAGTLESPLLLKRSGIQLPRLGKGLSIHPALGSFAYFETSLGQPWRAIPQSYEIRNLGSDKIQFEGFYVPPGLAAGSLSLAPKTLSHWMANVDHIGQFGFMVKDENKGHVREGLNGRPLVHYSLSKETQKLFALGSSILAELFIQGGAQEVATGIKGIGMVRTLRDARAIENKKMKASDYRPMGFHPLGTCAMGATAKEGVVDFDHHVFGTQNLYVVDGSTVPTSLGVNPQITIMSMALRAADIIAERL